MTTPEAEFGLRLYQIATNPLATDLDRKNMIESNLLTYASIKHEEWKNAGI